MKPDETVVTTAVRPGPLPFWVRLILGVCLFMCAGVTLVSLLSVFFYARFALWLGQPYDGLTRLDPLLIRIMFLSGALIYAVATTGCILMWRGKRKGFRIFAIPAFLLFGASLVFVFSPLSIIQLSILAITLLTLSLYLKEMV